MGKVGRSGRPTTAVRVCVFFWIEGYFLGGCDASFACLLDGGSGKG